MLSRSILLSLVAAAGVAAAAPASAADLNGYSYKPYKSGSPYDDPRYADPYGDEEPRYDTRRYRGSYKDDPVPYVEREPLPPSPPVPRNRYGYLEPMPAPPPPPVYVEPRYRRHAEPACAPRQVVMDRLRSEGATLIAVLGDLNDTPDSAALAPLLGAGDLKDAGEHPSFQSDGRPGTFQNGTARDKIDYLLLSPELFERMTGGGIWRKGVWGPGKRPAWEVYPEMISSQQAASDHAALWCDVDV